MVRSADSQFYTILEAARILKVNPSTIWRWIAAERLPAHRVGPRAIRIKQEDLEAVLRPAKPASREAPTDRERAIFQPPSQEEIARRKALVAEILALRQQCVITPLATADLVRKSREQERRAYGRPR
ncbi:MAG: helix-turn-helix domain-containing protein [Chloroflexi bacterium]|nr:helix-turn-helix domain-containing protein [Chloroflexota bacterium]